MYTICGYVRVIIYGHKISQNLKIYLEPPTCFFFYVVFYCCDSSPMNPSSPSSSSGRNNVLRFKKINSKNTTHPYTHTHIYIYIHL